MRLFLIMAVVTAVEVVLIAKVGSLIGFWMTLLIIISTAVIGSALLKRQWVFVMRKLQSLQSEPSDALLEALVLLICGVLLITPGFLTDIIGFLGLIPRLREGLIAIMRKKAVHIISRRYQHNSTTNTGDYTASRSDSHIIEGEFEHKDE